MQNISSNIDFRQKMEGQDRVALLIYNPDVEFSRCAFRSITEAFHLSQTISVFVADVNQAHDLPAFYEISGEPSLLLFTKGKLVKVVEGCHESDYFKAMMNHDLTEETRNIGTQ